MLDKDQFFEKYKVEEAFEQSDLSLDTLEAIYDDYCSREQEIDRCTKELEQFLRDNLQAQIHSIRCRKKDPYHLIEKLFGKEVWNRAISIKGSVLIITGRSSGIFYRCSDIDFSKRRVDGSF